MYERCAGRGFRLAAEPDSKLLPQPASGSIFRSYNMILERAAAHQDLEALVLAHQDVEILDPYFCEKVRGALTDPQVGVVGCVGAIGVRSIAWWEGAVTWASFVHRYPELGGGQFPSLTWNREELPPYARKGDADSIDGLLMVLSPRVVRNIRFDESLGLALHGYDYDLCLQVRAAGLKVRTEELRVIHHHSLELVDDPEPYVEAHVKLAEKWEGRFEDDRAAKVDWKVRTRQAEAEAAAARTQARSWQLQIDARVAQHERAMREVAESTSLRVTAPMRRLKAVGRPKRNGWLAKGLLR